jgi:hypothetical protein
MSFRYRRKSFLWKQTSAWVTLLFGILAASLLVTTIVLAILYGIERNKTNVQQQTQGKLYRERKVV